MKLQKFFPVLVPIFIVILSQMSLQAATKIQFSIVYTNDVMGEVEPCG